MDVNVGNCRTCTLAVFLPMFHLMMVLSTGELLQGVDMQLGLAIDSPKATLAVKRRIACEMVKYWHQVQDCIPEFPVSDGWGRKHHLFVKWKYVEAKVYKLS
jgi:hypothetical protein